MRAHYVAPDEKRRPEGRLFGLGYGSELFQSGKVNIREVVPDGYGS